MFNTQSRQQSCNMYSNNFAMSSEDFFLFSREDTEVRRQARHFEVAALADSSSLSTLRPCSGSPSLPSMKPDANNANNVNSSGRHDCLTEATSEGRTNIPDATSARFTRSGDPNVLPTQMPWTPQHEYDNSGRYAAGYQTNDSDWKEINNSKQEVCSQGHNFSIPLFPSEFSHQYSLYDRATNGGQRVCHDEPSRFVHHIPSEYYNAQQQIHFDDTYAKHPHVPVLNRSLDYAVPFPTTHSSTSSLTSSIYENHEDILESDDDEVPQTAKFLSSYFASDLEKYESDGSTSNPDVKIEAARAPVTGLFLRNKVARRSTMPFSMPSQQRHRFDLPEMNTSPRKTPYTNKMYTSWQEGISEVSCHNLPPTYCHLSSEEKLPMDPIGKRYQERLNTVQKFSLEKIETKSSTKKCSPVSTVLKTSRRSTMPFSMPSLSQTIDLPEMDTSTGNKMYPSNMVASWQQDTSETFCHPNAEEKLPMDPIEKRYEESLNMAKRPSEKTKTKCSTEGSPVCTFIKNPRAKLVTRFTYAVMSELQVAIFADSDRRGNRVGVPLGYKGVMCRHCKGIASRTGRYFPSSIKSFADSEKTLYTIYRHISTCKKCPDDDKLYLAQLFASHHLELRKKSKRHGSQRAFYRQIWNHLHPSPSSEDKTKMSISKRKSI